MKIAIYGAGSLGTVIGAYLTKAGLDVELINRNKKHIAALKKNGAIIEGQINMQVPVSALLPEEMSGKYNVIFLLTKQLDNANVVKSIANYLADDGVICTAQNGSPELSVAKVIGKDKTFGCAIAWGATMQEGGVCELTSSPDHLTFSIGALNPENTVVLKQIQEILGHMGKVEVEDNFIGVRWSKLMVNCAFSGMSAVLGCTFGNAAKHKESRLFVQKILKECIDVADAAGIEIASIQGKDIKRIINYKTKLKQYASYFIIPLLIKKHALLKASMLQDLEKGKQTEVDAINGIVCSLGKEHNVPTPYNDFVVKVVHDIEEGKLSPSFDNLILLAV